MGLEVLLYVPNIIDYIRIILLVISWIAHYTNSWVSAATYGLSVLLDGVDGYVARKWNQTSAFGAWLDIVIDILGRGMLWCLLYDFGYLVASVEWVTFVTTHSLGAEWKTAFVKEPWIVKKVMAKNFRTVWGVAVIGGIHVLPYWLYCIRYSILDGLYVPWLLQYLGIAVLTAGRLLGILVELWCIWSHILFLTSKDDLKSDVEIDNRVEHHKLVEQSTSTSQ